MQLERGQVAVITGGASGIGFAMAESFAKRGLDIVLADIDAGPLAEAVTAIESLGVSAIGVITDVRKPEQLDALAATTLDRFGRVDIICNNAGVASPMKPIWEIDERDWEWVLSVNLRGVISGMRAFVPHLVTQGSGHVVNTASMAGIAIIPTLGPYTAAKHAVVALSEVLAAELATAAPGVGVTVVCPGMIESNLSNAERNRPPELATGEATEPGVGGGRMAMKEGATPPKESTSSQILPASAVGEAVVAAVQANTLHISPNGALPLVKRRVERLIADLS